MRESIWLWICRVESHAPCQLAAEILNAIARGSTRCCACSWGNNRSRVTVITGWVSDKKSNTQATATAASSVFFLSLSYWLAILAHRQTDCNDKLSTCDIIARSFAVAPSPFNDTNCILVAGLFIEPRVFAPARPRHRRIQSFVRAAWGYPILGSSYFLHQFSTMVQRGRFCCTSTRSRVPQVSSLEVVLLFGYSSKRGVCCEDWDPQHAAAATAATAGISRCMPTAGRPERKESDGALVWGSHLTFFVCFVSWSASSSFLLRHSSAAAVHTAAVSVPICKHLRTGSISTGSIA